ncbi:MAG: HD domain-containing phosphohydrolase [Candidatus Omnitrophota bacterium]
MVINKVYPEDIINGIGAGLVLLDKHLRIRWVNKTQSDWMGLPQYLYSKHCYRIFERRRHTCRGCPTLKVFRTGKIHTARRIGYTKEGLKQYYQLTVSPIKDNQNKVIFALELIQNISEKVLQERINSKITHSLKRMHNHLFSVNRRLRRNVERVRELTINLSGMRRILEKKYRKKKNELTLIKEELQDIFKVNRVLSSTVDFKKVTSLITRLTCRLMHTQACILRLIDVQKKSLCVNASFGIDEALIEHLPILKVGESVGGRVAYLKKPLIISDIERDPGLKSAELLKKAGFRSLLCVPVLYQKKILGVITTLSKKKHYFSEEQIEVLSIFASQVAIAIQESKYYDDIHLNYFNTIHALVLAIEARDPFLRGHTERVTRYALETARSLNLAEAQLEILRYAAEVHDVGKISIPDFILGKPGKLTSAERAMIQLHPVRGAEILEPLEFLGPAIPIVRHHHERYDGNGYPDGLEKEKIPLMSRILACADAFDAMTQDRPYRRRKLTTEEALAEIKNNAGSQFDPDIAHLFIKTIQTTPP